MGAHHDFRWNPFTNVSEAVSISNELHTIPSYSPYTVRLYEVPRLDSPSTLTMRVRDALGAAITLSGTTSITVTNGTWFAVNKIITIDSEKMLVTARSSNTLTVTRGYAGTTATTHTNGTAVYIEGSMTEVAATPGAGEFWPDYTTSANNNSLWNTGTIIFNEADAGKVIAVNYMGTGTLQDYRVVPPGVVLMWSGAVAAVPYGWALCDGNNGTPNLLDKFIVGAGSSYNPNATGGVNSVTLAESQIPSHRHPITAYRGGGAALTGIYSSTELSTTLTEYTNYTGGGGSHENRPPYYALAYIMKL